MQKHCENKSNFKIMGSSVKVWNVKGKIKNQYDEHTLIG
jgi:hypothetical protein